MAFCQPLFKVKRVNLGLRHCLTKCALENKLQTKLGDLGIKGFKQFMYIALSLSSGHSLLNLNVHV